MSPGPATSKPDNPFPSRRRFFKILTAAFTSQVVTMPVVQLSANEMDEYAEGNIKLARRVPGSLNEQDMNFLQQLGIRWVRVDLTRKQTAPAFL